MYNFPGLFTHDSNHRIQKKYVGSFATDQQFYVESPSGKGKLQYPANNELIQIFSKNIKH